MNNLESAPSRANSQLGEAAAAIADGNWSRAHETCQALGERAVRYYLTIDNKIANNKELIDEIFDSAENSGEAMTFAAFEKWLDGPVRGENNLRRSSNPH